MATVLSPYGLMPTRTVGSQRFPSAGTMFPVTVNVTAPIYWHSPVALVAGGVKALAASPTTTASADSPVGVLNWAYWEDANGVHWSQMLPALTITGGSPTAWKVQVCVNDDPKYVFRIQGQPSVVGPPVTRLGNGDVGKTAALVNWASGNAKTGLSGAYLAVPGVTATPALKIIRVLDLGDDYPDVLVQWNGGVHVYENGFMA